jgi:hypothetical protein
MKAWPSFGVANITEVCVQASHDGQKQAEGLDARKALRALVGASSHVPLLGVRGGQFYLRKGRRAFAESPVL